MKKKILIGLVIILVIIGGIEIAITLSDGPKNNQSKPQTTETAKEGYVFTDGEKKAILGEEFNKEVFGKEEDYSEIANLYRPAHADWTYAQKYGIRDPRGGGRSSARLTAPTVAAGAIAKKWLKEQFNINIQACLVQLGNLELPINDWDEVDQNSFFCADKEIIPQLESFMDSLRKSGDSAGGRVFVKAENVPVGIGQPIYDRLDAELAFAFMGLNAVKGVEIGEGIKAARLKGSQNADQMDSKAKDHFLSNHSGGILGGISTGQTVYATVSIKPTPSIRLPLATLNSQMQDTTVSTKGRHDPCVSIRAVPVLEALMALVLMDLILQNHAQTGW